MRKRREENRRSSLKLVDELQELKLMTDQILPQVLEQILSDSKTADAVFSALVPALGEVLNCDRVFLYLRNPETQRGRVPYCWRRNSNYPDVSGTEWKKEPESLGEEDPLFAAALRTKPSDRKPKGAEYLTAGVATQTIPMLAARNGKKNRNP